MLRLVRGFLLCAIRIWRQSDLFRHTLATHLVYAGVEMAIVQQILGHESPEITQICAKVAIRHLKEVHHRISTPDSGVGIQLVVRQNVENS